MSATSIASLLQASPASALPGTWKLARGRAITLKPTNDGILRVAHGRVWATVEGPHGQTPTDSGDHVLEVGRSMWVRAGQGVVIEAWGRAGSAYFSWDPVAAPVAVPAPRQRVNLGAVVQPLADLRQALVLGGHAIARLVSGVGQVALALVVPRSASRPMRTCGAHGAMS